MKQSADNPAGNSLPAGLDADLLEQAVRSSGYPLQTWVASMLYGEFWVSEEWSYEDRDTKTLRALDIVAVHEIGESDYGETYELMLLVECKKPSSPFVFFKSLAEDGAPGFPHIYGLRLSQITLEAPHHKWDVSVAALLGLQEEPFVKQGPPLCTTFSKAIRKSKDKVELSGENTFNDIVLPLVKAMDHARQLLRRRADSSRGCPTTMALALCVVDGTMLVADARESPADLVLTPWVRVVRQETDRVQETDYSAERFYAIDVVHKDYVGEFLKKLRPFRTVFAKRVADSQTVLHAGKGYVESPHGWNWRDVKPTKIPSTPSQPISEPGQRSGGA